MYHRYYYPRFVTVDELEHHIKKRQVKLSVVLSVDKPSWRGVVVVKNLTTVMEDEGETEGAKRATASASKQNQKKEKTPSAISPRAATTDDIHSKRQYYIDDLNFDFPADAGPW
jgi:hypothetical protein